MVTDLFEAVASWKSLLLLVIAAFGFAPGFTLRLLVKIYPSDDPRRKELVAELYTKGRLERLLFVGEQLETVVLEGLPRRAGQALPASRRGAIIGTVTTLLLTTTANNAAIATSQTGGNRRGVPVFSDLRASAVLVYKVPYGKSIFVACKAENGSHIPSAGAHLYKVKIPSGEWGYAPSNWFLNGDALGTPGGRNYDPKIPDCDNRK